MASTKQFVSESSHTLYFGLRRSHFGPWCPTDGPRRPEYYGSCPTLHVYSARDFGAFIHERISNQTYSTRWCASTAVSLPSGDEHAEFAARSRCFARRCICRRCKSLTSRCTASSGSCHGACSRNKCAISWSQASSALAVRRPTIGYEIHITRKSEWSDESGPEISLDEWLEYVDGDEDMRADGFAEAETRDGSVLRVDDPGIAVWTAYSGHGVSGNMAWFSHFQDRISVKNPDEEILGKMHLIATTLNAKVQGDEGEEYGADGKALTANVAQSPGQTVPQSKPWWKFWS